MILLYIGKGLLFLLLCLATWFVGAFFSSLLFYVLTGREWTDQGAFVAGPLTLLLLLVVLGRNRTLLRPGS